MTSIKIRKPHLTQRTIFFTSQESFASLFHFYFDFLCNTVVGNDIDRTGSFPLCGNPAFSFRQLLDSFHVVQSFSKKGYPFDNAVCECFFKYLKKEKTNRRNYHTLQELYTSVFEYIEGYYNTRRPHSSLGLLTPNEKERLYWEQH